jgi:hypothetical protein
MSLRLRKIVLISFDSASAFATASLVVELQPDVLHGVARSHGLLPSLLDALDLLELLDVLAAERELTLSLSRNFVLVRQLGPIALLDGCQSRSGVGQELGLAVCVWRRAARLTVSGLLLIALVLRSPSALTCRRRELLLTPTRTLLE